jgi:hypothetical protein
MQGRGVQQRQALPPRDSQRSKERDRQTEKAEKNRVHISILAFSIHWVWAFHCPLVTATSLCCFFCFAALSIFPLGGLAWFWLVWFRLGLLTPGPVKTTSRTSHPVLFLVLHPPPTFIPLSPPSPSSPSSSSIHSLSFHLPSPPALIASRRRALERREYLTVWAFQLTPYLSSPSPARPYKGRRPEQVNQKRPLLVFHFFPSAPASPSTL